MIFDRYVLALDETRFVEPFAETCRIARVALGRTVANKRDHRQWLRACRERPARSAADKRDELAPPHSITSSARASIAGGIVRLSVFAILRLMTNSNLVGCSTGKSLGLAPCKILSTNSAARRNKSA